MENTLFVSTLPYSATSKDLETFCSEVGPLRSCFVVQDKTDPSKNAGTGFVTFVLADDAAKAIPALKKKKFMDLRFLKIQFARKPNDRQTAESPSDQKEKEEISPKIQKIEGMASRSMKSLLISDLPACITQKQLYKKVKKYGTVSSIKYSEGAETAIVDYNSNEEAANAFKHLNDHVFKGVKIKAELAKKQRYRLFLKNLHFQCTENDIRKVAAEFGDVKDISVPSKSETRGKGFAFLEYNSKEDCEKAILGLKGKKIRGREMIIDWAVSKKEFVELESGKNQTKTQDSAVISQVKDESELNNDNSILIDESLNADNDSQNDDDDSDPEDFEEESAHEEISLPNSQVNDDEKVQSNDQKKKPNKFMEETTLFIRNLSYEVTQDDLEKCLGVFGKLRYCRITMDLETGHSRGTGFVCFFEEEDAKACYNSYQEFMHTSAVDEWKESQFSGKGGKKAVSSLTPEPTKDLINSPFFLSGRLLNISWALSRSDATQAAKDGKAKRRAEDKRNMYLMTEGVILPDSDAAKGMSPSEVSRRQKSYSERKRLLALNPNLFMSKTRLSIRNLNLKVDDKLLQSAAQNAVRCFWEEIQEGTRESLEPEVMEEAKQAKYSPIGKKKVWVKQAKILRSKDRIETESKLGRSKGYGFVEFLHHCDALACLRWMNNNPNAFTLPDAQEEVKEKGNRHRPIVEFAVENKLVLKRRTERNNPKTAPGNKKRKIEDDTSEQKRSKKIKDIPSKSKEAVKSKYQKSKKNEPVAEKKLRTAPKTKNDIPQKANKTPKRKNDIPQKANKSKSLKAPISNKKIEKKSQKGNKKMINLNISLEDMKKWNA